MKLHHVVAAALLSAAAISPARANLVTDFNFDSVAIGSAPPTSSPGVDPQPQHIVYAIGGFPDVGPLTGNVAVQDIGTLTHAAVMTTDQGGTGSLYVDTQFNTTGQGNFATVSFDLDVLTTPDAGLPQGDVHAPNGQAFVIQAFGGVGQQRAFRFVVAPTSANGGVFGLRDQGAGDINPIGSYTDGDTHHVQLDLNFGLHSLDAFLDGVQVEDDYAFIDPVENLFEFFIFQNGVEDVTNSVAFDNLELTTWVPEPLTLSLFGAGLAGAVMLRRRKTK